MKVRDLFSIPNCLCYLRILIIPIFVTSYIKFENYPLAFGLLAFMEFTDFLDGLIARKFNMITDWGKIIDPVADKLLQFSLLIVLMYRYKFALVVCVLFVIKEVVLAVLGIICVGVTKRIEGAKIWGKISTLVFYVSCLILVIFPNIPNKFANILLLITLVFLIYSFVVYAIFFTKGIKNKKY